MDYVYIEQLIDRYFEAATTIEEERILRAFFSQREVPQHLRHYTPLFLMEADEIAEKPHFFIFSATSIAFLPSDKVQAKR